MTLPTKKSFTTMNPPQTPPFLLAWLPSQLPPAPPPPSGQWTQIYHLLSCRRFLPIPWLFSLQLPIFIEKSLFSHQLHQHQKTSKRPKKNIIKLLSTNPLNPTLFPLFPQRLLPDPLARQYPTPNIYWEIAIFTQPPPPPKKPKKITIDNKVTFHYPPAPDSFSTVHPKASA